MNKRSPANFLQLTNFGRLWGIKIKLFEKILFISQNKPCEMNHIIIQEPPLTQISNLICKLCCWAARSKEVVSAITHQLWLDFTSHSFYCSENISVAVISFFFFPLVCFKCLRVRKLTEQELTCSWWASTQLSPSHSRSHWTCNWSCPLAGILLSVSHSRGCWDTVPHDPWQ